MGRDEETPTSSLISGVNIVKLIGLKRRHTLPQGLGVLDENNFLCYWLLMSLSTVSVMSMSLSTVSLMKLLSEGQAGRSPQAVAQYKQQL